MPSDNNNSNNNNKTVIEKLKRIVNSFLARPDARAFAEPVDWRALELYDYPEIIKKMMDLGTIKRKLERDQYENGAQVAKDIRLVWSNCMTYNAEGSDLWLVAKDLSQRFEKKYESLKKQYDMGEASADEEEDLGEDEEEEELGEDEEEEEGDDDEEEDGEEAEFEDDDYASRADSASATPRKSLLTNNKDEPTMDEKADFSSDLFLLNGLELGYVMRAIECQCPSALEKGQAIPERVEIVVDELPLDLFKSLSQFASERAQERRHKLGVSTSPPPINDISNKRKRKR